MFSSTRDQGQTPVCQGFRAEKVNSSFNVGSRVTSYDETAEVGNSARGRILSISAMPVYKDKCHEELRWEDKQLGDKGTQAKISAIDSISSGRSAFSRQYEGSKVAPYCRTWDYHESSNGTLPTLESISAMFFYNDKSHEELRWEDYQLNNRGCGVDPASVKLTASKFPIDRSYNPFAKIVPSYISYNPFSTSSVPSNPFPTSSVPSSPFLNIVPSYALLNSFSEVEWVIDTGATCHVTSIRAFFSKYKAGDFGVARMGNHDRSKIVGMGDISIETNMGYLIVLKDVRHVPDLVHNFISGMALDKEGFVNYFGNRKWTLTMDSLVVARGHACNSLYKTQVKVYPNSLNTVKNKSFKNLEHRKPQLTCHMITQSWTGLI